MPAGYKFKRVRVLGFPVAEILATLAALRESDGLNGIVPRVALADSGDPGLISSTLSVSSSGRALRGEILGAAEQREMVAHGVSRGNLCAKILKPRTGRKKDDLHAFFRRSAARFVFAVDPRLAPWATSYRHSVAQYFFWDFRYALLAVRKDRPRPRISGVLRTATIRESRLTLRR